MSSQVQGTNDFSIVSKNSVVQQGYFKDNYIHHFVSKRTRRSPLINLGYYVRAVVIEKVLLKFISIKHSCQILSLGAGFDTSFFRLSELPDSKNVTYFEIDLPEVVKRKALIINSCNELISKLVSIKDDFSEFGLWSENYRLLAGDLRNLSVIKKTLEKFNFDFKKPTLLLSECSITYMDEKSSRDLIEFTGKLLQDTVFITYEQISPDDAFGTVMMNHFNNINCPLLSIPSYPLLEDQQRRFLNNGWQQCQAISAWEAFMNSTSEEERLNALKLEPFDEWEEWHLKCNHYTLVVAVNGCLNSWRPFSNFGNVSPLGYIESFEYIRLNKHSQQKFNFFGHCSLLYSDNDDRYIINIGGFGLIENESHGRLKNVTCFKLNRNSLDAVETFSCNENSFDFLHHSCTVINKPKIENEITFILYGGRKSPLSIVNSVPKLVSCKFQEGLLVETKDLIDMTQEIFSNLSPEPRWRHSACIMDFNSTKMFLIFGGCSQNLKVFDDFWGIDLNEPHGLRNWQRMNSPNSPCGRFSHSVSVDGGLMYLHGGLNNKLEALSDLWMWESDVGIWFELPIFSIIPRYGHTSHVFKNRHSSLMILVGGVSTHRETWPGIAVIDLEGLSCMEYRFPNFEPAQSIMLQNHSSVLDEDKNCIYVCGGGGNCFSFGTKFNSCMIEIPLEQFIYL